MKQNASLQSIAIWTLTAFTALVSSSPSSGKNTSSLPVYKKDPLDCDCFTVSGPDPGYFQHYKLWDFRTVPLVPHLSRGFSSLNGTINTEGDDSFDDGGDRDFYYSTDHNGGDTQPQPDSLYLFKTAFHRDWVSQQWHRPAILEHQRNVFLTRAHDQHHPNATYLVLRTTRHSRFTSTAEIETRVRDIWHCSLRVRLRLLPSSVFVHQPPSISELPVHHPASQHPARLPVKAHNTTDAVNPFQPNRPPSGACAGIFTYNPNCESDIEILTSDPSNRVRYANQPDYDPATDQMIPGASTIADIPVAWTTWSTHRLDWHPGMSRWYVDGMLQDSKSYQVPNLQSRLVINLWSDGGVWTGDIKLGESIFLGIEFIELAYNRSSDGNNRGNVPPEQRHGGHQLPLAGSSVADELDSFDDTEIVTGVAKRKKCRKGKKG
ncbi:Concanavalin A-like lectin/glucanases superfamily [Penicillium chermesinum]|nr:Concanavalin A-like lectin/glucanases superfamily [Penicillium chermesinum]